MDAARKRALAWELAGVPFIFCIGALLHFVYEWAGAWWPLALVAAVNESVWEHLKLAFWPSVIYAAVEYVAEQLGREGIGVPTDQIQREERPTAHRVDVRHAVGRCDASPGARIVDHRCDEVGSRHERALVVEFPDRGVVTGVGPDQQPVGMGSIQMAHNVRQLAGCELAASTGPVAELRQPNSGAVVAGLVEIRHRHPLSFGG